MAVKKEIKSQLAKLLATEDIIVEHKQCETAQFNVQSRVLTLPMWEKASSNVYDMLVGHEVGHALYTPDDWSWEGKIPQQFVNVCEDVRIEKLMKRRYLGIAKSFYRGYSELHEKDFFEVKDEDITSFNLADRANLYFKIGSFLDLSFSAPEQEIITLIQNAETFTDTIAAAETLYNFCKQKQQEEKQSQEGDQENPFQPESTGDSSGTGTSDTDSTDDNGSSISDSDSDADVESGSRSPNIDSGNSDSNDEPTVETAEALNSSLIDLINHDGIENAYVEIPDVDIDAAIASNEEVHKEIDNHFAQEQVYYSGRAKEYHFLATDMFGEVDVDYRAFKKEAQKEVSYLVKEFECKKAADSYARSSTSRTGVLDTTKLQTYKFNEDLFKKVTVLSDGKNHGLIFILDWSGSMSNVIKDTIKQLYNLIWFCRKVQIPFEVYAFTQEWNRREMDYETGQWNPKDSEPLYEAKENVFRMDECFSLMNLFTSKVNGKTLEHQMLNIWRTVSAFYSKGIRCYYQFPPRLSLSGTPLNEALICLHKILPQFQKENKLQKVQCIILTDGEAAQLPYHKEVNRHWEDEPYLGTRNVNPNHVFLRDRKMGKTYSFGYAYYEFTGTLIQNLKDHFPSANFIGIRVLEPRDASYFIKRYYNEYTESVEYGKIMSEWRKTKTFNIKNSTYDAYFGMSSSALSQDSEFDVDDSATKAQIKRAFVKSLKTKKLNKKVLGEFIDLVV
jgi:hypothetical protein